MEDACESWTQVASSDTLVPGMLTQDCRIIFGQTPRGSRPHHDGSPPSPAAVEVRRMRCAQRGPALLTSWRSATQQSAWKLSPDAAEASLQLLHAEQPCRIWADSQKLVGAALGFPALLPRRGSFSLMLWLKTLDCPAHQRLL